MAHHVHGAAHRGRLEPLALLHQHDELLEQGPDPLGLRAVEGDLVAPHVDRDVGEGGLDDAQHLVPLAEEGRHEVVGRDGDLDLGAAQKGAISS